VRTYVNALLVSALVIGLPTSVTYAQLDQRELAQHILSGDSEQRNTALGKIRTLDLKTPAVTCVQR